MREVMGGGVNDNHPQDICTLTGVSVDDYLFNWLHTLN